MSVSNTKAAAQMREALRREIIFGMRDPGERLIEADLAENFAVGRHVVRSALSDLERIGLVERRPNCGVMVVDYTREEIEELYEMREILQSAAVRRIAMPVARSTIALLEEINEAYRQSSEAGDLDAVVEANNQFHRTLFGLCGNRYLAHSIDEHWQKTAAIHSHAIARPERARVSHQQHAAMIDALRRADRAALDALCIEHMQPALEIYSSRRAGYRFSQDKG